MTSIRMALSELQRLTSGRLPRLALLALVLVPTIYAGLYLYANNDPYGGLDRVPAALVVLDQGATGPNGKAVDAGRQVGDQLRKEHDFDWHEVGAAQAARGVREGTYDFALTIPADFSASLTSAVNFDPRQAQLQLTTNDANSYLSTTIANTVSTKVKEALASQVGADAAEQFLLGFGKIKTSLVDAADGAARLAKGISAARSGSARLSSGATDLATGAARLQDGLALLRDRTVPLPQKTSQLATGAAAVAAGDKQVAGVGDQLATVSNAAMRQYRLHRTQLIAQMTTLGLDPVQQAALLQVYDDLRAPLRQANLAVQGASTKLDQLASGAQAVADGTKELAGSMPALVTAVRQARQGSAQLSTGAGRLASGADELDRGLLAVRKGGTTLHDRLAAGADSVPSVDDTLRQRMAQTIGNPVRIADSAQTAASSYGAGLAPFFMALAAWIGGYVLFLLVRPLSRRAIAANQSPLRTALAGWITPALLGAAQMTTVLLVVLLALRIVPANVVGTLLFLLLMSATFIAVVHALNAWFGTVGQFLGLVLMVLQLVTAGGTFPWQTIPVPLHWLHHLLPMSYAVDGLRQLMYGGLSGLVGRDALVLLAWLVVAIAATALAARRQRVWTVARVHPELSVA